VLDYDFENSAGFWIMTASHDYERAFNDELAPEGITLRQCQVLGFLALAGPLAQNELAERMRIEPPTLVGILDRMERDGWIEGRPARATGGKLIQPQSAAKPVWERIVKVARRLRAQSHARHVVRRQADLAAAAGSKVQNLKARAAARSGVSCAVKVQSQSPKLDGSSKFSVQGSKLQWAAFELGIEL
jgi:MarR family transcriptional regulator for hemolysin